MADYIRNEADKVRWLLKFALWFDLHGVVYGLTPAQELRMVHAAE